MCIRDRREPDQPWGRWTDRNWRGGRTWGRAFLMPRCACANRIVGAGRMAAMPSACRQAVGRGRRQMAGIVRTRSRPTTDCPQTSEVSRPRSALGAIRQREVAATSGYRRAAVGRTPGFATDPEHSWGLPTASPPGTHEDLVGLNLSLAITCRQAGAQGATSSEGAGSRLDGPCRIAPPIAVEGEESSIPER